MTLFIFGLVAGALPGIALVFYFRRRFRDLTDHLKDSEHRHQQLEELLGRSTSVMVLLDKNTRPIYLHHRHAKLLGIDASPKGFADWVETLLPSLRQEARESVLSGQEWRGEISVPGSRDALVMAATATPVMDPQQQLEYVIIRLENITDNRQLAEQLFQQQHFNSLTELPNRHHALIELKRHISHCRARHSGFMVIHIDLDRVRYINDSFGHQTVDQLFVETAERLRRCVKPEQVLAHLGADEFLIVLEEGSCQEEAVILAEVILERLREPFQILKNNITVTASIGTAHYPVDSSDAATLMRRAEAAMYEAKKQGGNRFSHFESELSGQLIQRVEIESHLRQAIARDELSLYFQPLIDARSNKLCAAEVLLRWRNNSLNNPGPDQFIPVAEETGLIVEIGDWVLLNACKQAVAWRREGLPKIKIAINISARQFEDGAIIDSVRNALKQSGLPANQLELEITEGLLINDSSDIHAAFMELKNLGVQMSLDDFGTGYASLSYLKRYPFDVLKIDRCFVHDIESSSDSLTLVNAIIAMAHSFDMHVVAEGVETVQQRRLLRDRSCDFLQGYLYSSPLSANRFGEWMRHDRHAQTKKASV